MRHPASQSVSVFSKEEKKGGVTVVQCQQSWGPCPQALIQPCSVSTLWDGSQPSAFGWRQSGVPGAWDDKNRGARPRGSGGLCWMRKGGLWEGIWG